MFDRSWYNRAGVERVMGFCTDDHYRGFLRQAPAFEQVLTNDRIDVVKFWFSVSRTEQLTRFAIRQVDPVRQWKLSPMELASLDKWDSYTTAKETMFLATDTAWAPWTVVKSNDKKRARPEAMRHVLHMFDYGVKDTELVADRTALLSARPRKSSKKAKGPEPNRPSGPPTAPLEALPGQRIGPRVRRALRTPGLARRNRACLVPAPRSLVRTEMDLVRG